MKNPLYAHLAGNPQPTVIELISIGGIAKPPSDSVLNLTLPELLGLTMEEVDSIWEAFDWIAIGDLGSQGATVSSLCDPQLSPEDSIELLLASSIGYLRCLVLDERRFDEVFIAAIEAIGSRLGHAVRPRTELLSARAFLSGVEDALPPALALSSVRGADTLARCFPNRRISHVSDLLDLSERCVILELGFGAAALEAIRICWLLREELDWLNALKLAQSAASSHPVSLRDEVSSAFMAGLPAKKSREVQVRVLLRRLGLESGRPMTLEEAATPFQITRERVRQIEARSLQALDVASFMEELVPMRMDLYCIVASQGRGMPAGQLATLLADKRGWSETPSAASLHSVAKLLPECLPDTAEEIVILSDEDCSECQAIGRVVDEAVSEGAPVALLDIQNRVAIEAASTRPDCHVCAQHDPMVFGALLDMALATRGNGVRKAGWILPQVLAGRRPLSLAFRAEEVLRRSGACLHFGEVARLLAQEEPNRIPPTPRKVYAALDRQPDVIHWEAGSFIHKENMPFPYAVIRSIEESIAERLEHPSCPPMLSVHGVYELFRQELEAADIPSELALYSLLRISGEPKLLYPRYPQVYLKAGFEERLSLALVLDDFARNAGGVVSADEMRQFVTQDMGFKEFQLMQALTLLPSILRVGDGAYLHVDYTQVPVRVLDKIVRHAEDLVHQEGFVSVQRIYDDLEVDCVLSGIKSPEMLFSLLQLDEREDLMANRYPLLVHKEGNNASAVTVQASLAIYLEEKNAPCSTAELEEEFVDKRGYDERTVHLAWLHSDVYRYLPGSLVHKTTIQWDEVKQASLEEAAFQFAEDYSKAGSYFATIQDLLEYGSLPDIGRDLVWTQQLAADLLSRGDRCSVLGNARNAYVTNPNRYGISNLGDLVTQMVRSDYGGGANLSMLQTRLQAEGVILRSLTQAMLGPDAAVAVVGQEVILNGLVDA